MNILLLGHAIHGKSTAAQMIHEKTGLKYEDSSTAAARIFIYDALKERYGYSSLEECYVDRRNHRAEWYNLICGYNKDDKARLAKEIMKSNDIYVGMRDREEIEECMRQNVFDLVIGVFDPEKPLEESSSFNINLFKASDIILISGDLEKLENNIYNLLNGIL